MTPVPPFIPQAMRIDPPYTRESIAKAKARQELERDTAAIEMHLPTSLQHMVKGD